MPSISVKTAFYRFFYLACHHPRRNDPIPPPPPRYPFKNAFENRLPCFYGDYEKAPKDSWTCPVCRKKKYDADREAKVQAKVQAKREQRKRELEAKQAKSPAKTVRWCHGSGSGRVPALLGFVFVGALLLFCSGSGQRCQETARSPLDRQQPYLDMP